MIIYTICRYFVWYILYSVAGWILETLLYIFRDGKVVKRGFLFGPLCPIYGAAALICNAALYGRVHNIGLIFLAGFFLCGALEYLTHFIMEKIFNAMWWDYSDRRFNIKGRVYLKGLIFFGVGTVLIVRVLQPLVVRLTDAIPHTALYWICFVLYTVLLMDAATTIADVKGSIKSLKHMQSVMLSNTQEGVDRTSEQLEQFKENIKGSEIYVRTLRALTEEKSVLNRMRRSYPDFKIKKYRFVLDILMDPPQEGKRSTDKKLYGTADSLPQAEEETDKTETDPNEPKPDSSASDGHPTE